MIKCVAFDLDGTLYDYEVPNTTAENCLYDYMKSEFNLDILESKKLLYTAKEEIKKNLVGTASSHNRLLYMQKVCELINVNPLKHTVIMYDIYWDTFIKNMELFTYVKKLFVELKNRNIKIAILTDLTAYIQYKKIKYLGIVEYIDYIITSEEVGTEKPNIRNFDMLLKKTKCERTEIIYVGDDAVKDVGGANASKIKSILFDKNIDIYAEVIKNI